MKMMCKLLGHKKYKPMADEDNEVGVVYCKRCKVIVDSKYPLGAQEVNWWLRRCELEVGYR